MNVEALKLFVEVANRLSFASVARDRGSDPSSVSRTIGHLEDELGLRLFHRSTRKMTLTDGGAVFLQRISGVVDELEQARDEARGSTAQPRGSLRLTASVAFGERMVVPLLPGFRAAFPKIRLDLLLSDSNLDLVGEGIDLAIRLGTRMEGGMIARRLLDTRYRVCASPDYLRSAPPILEPEDLSNHRCLLFTLPGFRSSWRFRDAGGRETSIAVDGDLAISSALSLRSAALGGFGPTLLADWLIGPDLADGALIDPFPEHEVTATQFDTAAWMLYPSHAYLPQKVRVAIDYLHGSIGRGPCPG